MNTTNKTGFTLIEVLVSVFLFFGILAVILGFFGYAIKAQKKALASQEISDQISYVMEYMGRSIRMARKDVTGTCIAPGTNYENPGGNNFEIRFLNYEGICQEFYLENEQLKRRKSSDGTAGNFGSAVDLTSSKLKINSAKFNLIGENETDNIQPRVTIFLDVEKQNTKPEFNAKIKIQSTISQRNLDVN
jgi:type II secretory pathway pseudopilin PulG